MLVTELTFSCHLCNLICCVHLVILILGFEEVLWSASTSVFRLFSLRNFAFIIFRKENALLTAEVEELRQVKSAVCSFHSREFKKLRRQLQRKRRIRIELCVQLRRLRLFHVDHIVQNRRIALPLAW